MKRKHILLTSVLILLNLGFVIGQTTLAGRVLDDKGEFVILGNVILYQNDTLVRGTETDFDGNFYFSKIVVGIYDVHFEYVGYPTLVVSNVHLDTTKKMYLDVSLEQGSDLSNKIVLNNVQLKLRNSMPQHLNNSPFKNLAKMANATCNCGWDPVEKTKEEIKLKEIFLRNKIAVKKLEDKQLLPFLERDFNSSLIEKANINCTKVLRSYSLSDIITNQEMIDIFSWTYIPLKGVEAQYANRREQNEALPYFLKND